MSNVVFVIPARGGSKGIPNKNIKLFCGHPLIAWSIMAAKDTALGEVLVSSDSDEILKVAEKYGAIAVKRPADISGDKSSSEDAIKQALLLHFDEKTMPDTTFFLQCTSPWITTQDMLEAHKTFELQKFDSLGLVKPCHLYTGTNNNTLFKRDQNKRLMRQDMEKRVTEIGAYIFKTKPFLIEQTRYFGKTGCYIINRELPSEIDSPIDWKVNETFFSYWRTNQGMFCPVCKQETKGQTYCSKKCYRTDRKNKGWNKTKEMMKFGRGSVSRSKQTKVRTGLPFGDNYGPNSVSWRGIYNKKQYEQMKNQTKHL